MYNLSAFSWRPIMRSQVSRLPLASIGRVNRQEGVRLLDFFLLIGCLETLSSEHILDTV